MLPEPAIDVGSLWRYVHALTEDRMLYMYQAADNTTFQKLMPANSILNEHYTTELQSRQMFPVEYVSYNTNIAL